LPARYLLFEYIPTPRTIYRDVARLEPAHILRVDRHGQRLQRYWDLPRPQPGGGSPGAMKRWAHSLAGAFQVSVLARREADVPVGVLLSGGLDSSAVLAVADRGRQERSRSFTVTMGLPSFDEAAPARATAQRYRTEHQEIYLGEQHLSELLDDIAGKLDEPLGDSSLPATWHLFRHVRDAGFKAVLSGDGGDELMAGYPTYLAHRWASLARPLAPALRSLAARLPVSYDNVSFDYKLRRFAAGLSLPMARRNQVWLGAFLPDELPADLAEELWSETDAHGAALQGLPAVCRAMALDQRLYLGDGVLVKVDRASQAHGVEVRTPFLDYRFVELAAQVPERFKLHGTRTKAVWRLAAKELVPPSILDRPKKGFGTPVGPWLRGPCTQLLDGLEERVRDWLPGEQVRRLVRQHRQGQADHRRRLWSLLVLGRWREGPWGPG